MTTPHPALLDLAAALRRALPQLADDPVLASHAQSVEALIARRLGLPTPHPARAERRRTSEEERYRHE